jgi:hypothetical protein
LFLLSLVYEDQLHFFASARWPEPKQITDVILKPIKELVHSRWVFLNNLKVALVVVSVGSLNLVQDAKTLVKFRVEHHMVDCLLHQIDLTRQFILQLLCDLVVLVCASRLRHLEVLLGLLEALLVLVKFGREALEKVYDSLSNILHLAV